jgi:hypothetical protein
MLKLTWFKCTMFYCNPSGDGRVTVVRRPEKSPKKDQRRIKEGSKNGQITASEATYIAGSVANKL